MDQHDPMQLKKELKQMQKKIKPFVLNESQFHQAMLDYQKQKGQDAIGLVPLISQVDRLLNLNNTPPQDMMLFIKQNNIITEILSLLKDGYNGKLNNHLQQILDSADIELKMINTIPGDSKSPEKMQIKINLAATVIDKYSTLLKRVIGEKSLTPKEKTIVVETHQLLNRSTNRLDAIRKRMDMIVRVNVLQQEITDDAFEYQSMHCFFFLGFHKSTRNYRSLTDILSNLSLEPLSLDEIAGGLYRIRQQLDLIPHPQHRSKINQFIEQLLKNNGYLPKEASIEKQLILIFNARADILGLNWPKPFELGITSAVSQALA